MTNSKRCPKYFCWRSWLKALPLALLVLAVACSMPTNTVYPTPTPYQPKPTVTPPPPPTPTPPVLPPAVVESDPPEGSEIPLSGEVTLYFNQKMDRPSVEAALNSQPEVDKNIKWGSDAALTFSPKKAFSPGEQLVVNLAGTARSALGLALSQPVSIKYRTAGYLKLVQSLPKLDAVDIDPSSAVVASFSRPVVALGADPATLPAAFTLQPAAQGRGEWVNTSTYVFYPEPPLEGGQKYTVQVNPDLRGTDGNPLKGAVDWSFTTAAPRLVFVLPSSETGPTRLDAPAVLTFNQPMDTTSVEANFSLAGPEGPVAGKFTWSEDNTVVTYTTSSLLARSSEYTLALNGEAKARGGSTLGAAFSTRFQTVPALAVKSTDPAQGKTLHQYSSIQVYLTAPIQDKDLEQYVTLTPEVPNLNISWEESTWSLRLYGEFTPNSEYVLTLSPELSDLWGGKLGQAFTQSIPVGPLDPTLYITYGSDSIFMTPQDASIRIQAANLPSISLAGGSLDLADFWTLQTTSNYDLRQSYQPKGMRTWEQAINAPADRVDYYDLYYSADRAAQPPGLYFLRINDEGNHFYTGPFFIIVSNLQITLKASATDILAWVVDLRSGAPVAAAAINLYDDQGNLVASGATNDQGVWTTKIPPSNSGYSGYYAITGQPGDDLFGIGTSSWVGDVTSWDYGFITDTRPPHLEAYFYSDRPIFRPGQTVYFRAVVRQAYNGRYTLPDISTLPVTITNDTGEAVAGLELPISAYGTAHGEYTLPDDSHPGYYGLSTANNIDGSLQFKVADYRKPEINLQVSFPAEQIRSTPNVTAAVSARYFFDAPAGNVPLHWVMYVKPSTFYLPGYQVGIPDTSWMNAFRMPGPFFDGAGTQLVEGDAKTSPDGTVVLEVPLNLELLSKYTRQEIVDTNRLHYTLEVTAKDESGLPVSGRAEMDVNPADFFIGVKPDTWSSRAGTEMSFEVQVSDWYEKPAGVRLLKAEFNKVVWERKDPPAGRMGDQPTFTPIYTPVGSSDLRTSEQGLARVAFTPSEPGTYQLSVSGTAPDSLKARTELLVWVGGPGQAVWPDLPSQRLQLTADRDSYRPGDTAQVFVPNSYGPGCLALVTVERGVVLRYQVLTLDEGGSTLSFPLTSDDAPNVYIAVTLLGKNARGLPDYRQGYINLPVEPIEQVLKVSLASQPQRAGPGDEVNFDIQVTDAAGKPVQGEFSLAVVDQAVLALSDPNSKDIVPTYYGIQPLGVRTGQALAVYGQRTAYVAGGMGGGGGDIVPTVVRENFPDTAYWDAQVVTGPDGKANVRVSLPDTLTTWQLDTRGLTDDTRVGQAQSEIVSTKDLLVRPVAPRFLVADDHAMVSTVVQNNTDQPLPEVTVSLQAEGFTLDDPAGATQKVSVPAMGRTRVNWWGRAQAVTAVDLVFSARAGNLEDAARPALGSLPVLHYNARQAFATSGTMDEGGERLELVSLPLSFDPTSGSLDVELSPSLGAATIKALDVLEHYPYECTEQTISRFLPNLESFRALKQLGVESPNLKLRLERTLNKGVQQLEARQNPDGGWSWWQGGSSDPYISAYVVFGLSRASEAGVEIAPEKMQRALEYIKNAMAAEPLDPKSAQGWQLDRLAFEHFALAQAGSGEPEAARQLYAIRDQLSPWAQALTALDLERFSPGSQEARTLVSDLAGKAIRSATGVHWEIPAASGQNMVDNLANSAMVLYAVAQLDPVSPLRADAVRYLVANRQADGSWGSTYTTAWTVMALTEVMKTTNELNGTFGFGAALNGTQVASGQAGGSEQLTPVTASTPVNKLYPNLPNALVIQRKPGTGRLYYTAALNISRPVDSVPALNQGLSLSRAYYPFGAACQDKACSPVQSIPAGEKVTVRLTLNLPNDAYNLMVEDYIPAGAEILDTSLKTSEQGSNGTPEAGPVQPSETYDARSPYAMGWGWWYFHPSQIYDDHIAWAADYLPAGTYELTYTLVPLQPGEYKVIPARAWQFYFPDVQGNTPGTVFEIK